MRVLFPGIEDHPVLRELEVRGETAGRRKRNKEGQEKVEGRFKIDIRGKAGGPVCPLYFFCSHLHEWQERKK